MVLLAELLLGLGDARGAARAVDEALEIETSRRLLSSGSSSIAWMRTRHVTQPKDVPSAIATHSKKKRPRLRGRNTRPLSSSAHLTEFAQC